MKPVLTTPTATVAARTVVFDEMPVFLSTSGVYSTMMSMPEACWKNL